MGFGIYKVLIKYFYVIILLLLFSKILSYEINMLKVLIFLYIKNLFEKNNIKKRFSLYGIIKDIMVMCRIYMKKTKILKVIKI